MHNAVLREGMRDISKDAVERLLATLADDDIDADNDIRAAFAYELAKDKMKD